MGALRGLWWSWEVRCSVGWCVRMVPDVVPVGEVSASAPILLPACDITLEKKERKITPSELFPKEINKAFIIN